MAQTNYTPISLYYSTTASAVPTAANLVPGELAINTNDGKLYYEDSSGVVQVLATKSTGSIGGSNTQVQFNNSGSLGGSSSFTWDGTTVTATKFAGAFNGTVGATTASTGAFTTLSTSSTTTLSGLTASTALALDASKNVVSVTNTGTGNNVLSASPTLTGTIAGASLSLSSLTSGRVTYAGASGLLTDSANLTYGTGLSVNGISQVYQTGLYTTDGTLSNYSVNNGVYLNGNATGWSQLSGDGTRATFVRVWGSGASPANFIVLNTAGSERMRVDSSGNVGIGTSSPSDPLSVQNDGVATGNGWNEIVNFRNAAQSKGLNFGYNPSANNGTIVSQSGGSASGIEFWGYTGSAWAERMRIDSSGNLLVGQTSISTTTAGIALQKSQGANIWAMNIAGAASTSSSYAHYVYSTTASAYRFLVDYAGTIFATSTSITAISDQTLKTNIKPLETGLNEVMKLQPRRFDWINGDATNVAGFVAQEVQEVLPDLVGDYKYSDTETKLGLKMGDMIPTLVKAIQELKTEFDAYKATHP